MAEQPPEPWFGTALPPGVGSLGPHMPGSQMTFSTKFPELLHSATYNVIVLGHTGDPHRPGPCPYKASIPVEKTESRDLK